MKKHIFKIISIFTVFVIMFNVVGCKKKNDNHQHDLKYYEKTKATCEKEGNIEYWKCTTCNKYFSDAKGEKEISDVTIKKLGHQYIALAYSNLEHIQECKNCHNIIDKEEHIFDENGKCSICDYQDVLEYSLLEDNTYEVQRLTNKDATKVVIPNYYNDILVTSVGRGAFGSCTNLESITIPSSITSIGWGAFAGCTNLHEVNIQSIISWCKISFSIYYATYSANPLCEGAVLKINGEKITNITEDMLEGVTSIELGTFYGYTSLESVTIPSSVTSIGESAFEGCTSLESVTIPSSVTSIGNGAFYDCTNLKKVNIQSIESWCKIEFNDDNPLLYAHNLYVNDKLIEELEIPDTVDNIPYVAFAGGSFSKVIIPKNTINIGLGAFAYCSNLSSIIVDSNNPIYDSRDNCNAIIETSTNTLIAGCKDTIIPSSVTGIGEYAFYYCTSLESIIIPFSVTGIGEYAFSSCTSLENIIIPFSVTGIGEYAFSSCTSLENIIIPSNVTSIGFGAFSGCESLIKITIEEGVISIGQGAFCGCANLESITIPSSVKSIDKDAFDNCKNLKEVNIASLASWFQISFISEYEAAAGYTPNNPLSNGKAILKMNGEEITNITEDMLEGVTSISSYAFYEYTSLESIILPSSVTSIGLSAFRDCTNLQSITIPSSVQSIGLYAFSDCTNLSEVTIEEGVQSIGSSAFSGCINLKKVTIEEGVTSIGSYAFYDCTSLQSITIPSSVQSIGSYAFSGCTNLSDVRIEEGVTSIGDSTFYKCTSLQSITIPSSIISIGWGAFAECTNLKELIFEDPNNWKLNRRIISSDDLNNSELAASYLTGQYCRYTWTKQTA